MIFLLAAWMPFFFAFAKIDLQPVFMRDDYRSTIRCQSPRLAFAHESISVGCCCWLLVHCVRCHRCRCRRMRRCEDDIYLCFNVMLLMLLLLLLCGVRGLRMVSKTSLVYRCEGKGMLRCVFANNKNLCLSIRSMNIGR